MNRLLMDVRYTDALSGEFIAPGCQIRHTLARLACATYEKGQGPDNCRDYIPSWASGTYAMLELDDGPVSERLTLAESRGRWPQQLRIGHETLRVGNKDVLVVQGSHGLDVAYPLDGSVDPNLLRHDIAEQAEEFYKLTAQS